MANARRYSGIVGKRSPYNFFVKHFRELHRVLFPEERFIWCKRLDARRFQQLVLERMRTVAHDAGRWTSRTPPPAYELLCLEVNQICEPIGRVNIVQWLNRIAEFDIPLADEGRELEW